MGIRNFFVVFHIGTGGHALVPAYTGFSGILVVNWIGSGVARTRTDPIWEANITGGTLMHSAVKFTP